MQRRMLSKEDEATTGGEDIEVRREDQDKINRFSRLHQRELNLVEELKSKEKEKEDLEEVSTELELADEDTKIPYKIGDSFISLPPAEAQELLAESTQRLETGVTELEEKLSLLREEMDELKVSLYARFALESDSSKNVDVELHQIGSKCQEQASEKSRSRTRSCSRGSHGSKTVIEFNHDDPDDPHNWPFKKKAFIIAAGIVAVLNSTIGSSLSSGVMPQIATHFTVTNQEQLVLPTSIFLLGYVVGPLGWGPVSEAIGRYPILISSFSMYLLWMMASALAPTWAAFNVFRFLAGVCASCPISVVGGLFADVFNDLITRGRALAVFMASTCLGPVAGPIISGFLAPVSWNWPFWAGTIVAGASWVFLLITPETYGPVILKKRAQAIRKTTKQQVFAPIELEATNWGELLRTVLARPFRMLFFESLVLFCCLFQAYIYGLFYMFFFAYPIIYQGTYGFNAGEEGLAFLPIAVGSAISCAMYLGWDYVLRNAQQQRKPWSLKEENRRLPLACFGGPLFAVSLFWLGWAARPSVHWIVPILAGIPCGIGYLLIFMALLNYIVDAYADFAASALAAAACSRSLMGVVLPFAAKPLYNRLGVPWACSLLGFLCLLMCVIPLVFIKFGDQIRARSKWCQELARRREEAEAQKRQEGHASSGTLPIAEQDV
ncbi:MAG: hypothetical protein M1821_009881 [Bathelium mastoideum]|nr:MAG: hypothetical protein M1821_009881 [Bathelium mastoideum]